MYSTDCSDDICGNIPETNTFQCYKFISSCQEVELDRFWHIDDSGECIEKIEGKLTENEIYDFTDSFKTKCQKREKLCTDLEDNTYQNYTPIAIAELCFELKV